MQYQPTTNARRRGLVILLGWMGAQPHHLEKYGAMWRELGFDTLSFTASPMLYYLSWVAKWRAATLLDALKTHGWGKNQPVLFHVFSNNGGNMFTRMNTMLDVKRYVKVRDYVRGVIYDSLPAHLTGRFHAPLWREAMGWGPIRIFFLRIFLFFIRLLFNMKKIDADYFRSLATPPNNCPTLLLYSTADTLIPADSVRELAEQLRSRGNNVTTHDFISTPHVAHLRYAKDDYLQQINAYLKQLGV